MSAEHARSVARAERARLKLNATPWWRPIKRQDAALEYRYAMLEAALTEMRPPGSTES